jgi:hypothetical protein
MPSVRSVEPGYKDQSAGRCHRYGRGNLLPRLGLHRHEVDVVYADLTEQVDEFNRRFCLPNRSPEQVALTPDHPPPAPGALDAQRDAHWDGGSLTRGFH